MNLDPATRVMTILGPVAGEDLGPVLTHEHLVCDSTRRKHNAARAVAHCSNSTSTCARGSQDPPIALEHLASIRSRPFQHEENMTLASTEDACRELQNLAMTGGGCRTILDVTSTADGRDHKAALQIARRLGINIVIGSTCPVSDQAEDPTTTEEHIEHASNDVEAMERELLYGIDDDSNVRAGFLGEVVLSDEFRPAEVRSLKACCVVQGSTNAPLIVSEAQPKKHALKILDRIQQGGGSVNRTVLAHMDMYVMDLRFLRQVLDRDSFVSFDRYSVASICYDPDGVFPRVIDVVECIWALLKANSSYVNQILLSSGVCMKLQHRKYGGFGFDMVFEQLLPRLRARGVTEEQIDTIVCKNPRRLLQWWTEPPEPERPKEYLPCSICHELFEPIEGEYFTKYTFTYCGTKCLRKHRKMDFKEIN